SLGYAPSDALKAVRQIAVTKDMDAGTILKQALKIISTL
ncbi:MAG: RuvA C-terminal domain-containing protein, partial [Lachnospiraceae bacterium]|nr:RuvA C-terminal domain-containing protein [Lachnospiraceae bacterium]